MRFQLSRGFYQKAIFFFCKSTNISNTITVFAIYIHSDIRFVHIIVLKGNSVDLILERKNLYILFIMTNERDKIYFLIESL